MAKDAGTDEAPGFGRRVVTSAALSSHTYLSCTSPRKLVANA